MIRELIGICRELGLGKRDVLKGVGLCFLVAPLVYAGYLVLWLFLAIVADYMGG